MASKLFTPSPSQGLRWVWQLAVPWIFLLALLRINICFPPALRNLSWQPWPFKSNQEWPHSDSSQLAQHLWCIPFGPMDFPMSHLFKCSLIWSSFHKGKSFLLQTFLLVWRNTFLELVKVSLTSKDQSKKALSNTAPFSSRNTFSLLLF